jgi:TolB-like protein/Tfp pilus assembly protein PilF
MSFLGELRKRKVFRVGGAYIVAAWVLIQVAATVFPQLQLPDWAPTLVTVSLILGFPIALLLAWFLELTPGGIRRTVVDPNAAEPASRYSAVTYVVMVTGLFLVTLYLAWIQFDREPAPVTDTPTAADQLPSIAVLPFVDMSPDGSQAYFGDGMAEELLNELARLDGLRVAGRTSSFSYKDSKLTIPEIGQSLKVQSVLEGSVRKDGERLRITAQLIESSNGYHLWSDTYDRDFRDVFAIQKEIAEAITGALGVKLGIGNSNTFKGAGTSNVEAYEHYLKGSAEIFYDKQTAQRLLDKAIALDPDYAAAWALRGVSTASLMWNAAAPDAPALLDEAYHFVQRAVELDPNSQQALTQWATIIYARYDWLAAQQAFTRALALGEDRLAFNQYGNMLMRAGRMREARQQYDLAEAAEPLGGRPADLSVNASLAQGHFDEARRIMDWRPPTEQNQDPPPVFYWLIVINTGDREGLKVALANRRSNSGAAELLYAPVAENLDSTEAVHDILHTVYADETAQWASKLDDIALLAAFFGDHELALDAKGREARLTVVRLQSIWFPVMAEVRRLPGFKQLLTDLKLVEYWRSHGWADFCRPLGSDDFTCSAAP